jgi:hypothetical protein
MARRKIRGYRTIELSLNRRGTVAVRTSPRTADALEELSNDMDLYRGVRFAQVLEAAYEQGRKDGAREVIEGFERVAQQIPHKAPGRPRQR